MRIRIIGAACLLPALALSAVYELRPNVQDQTLHVTIRLYGETESSQEFHMAGWAPGDYWMFDYGNAVRAIGFYMNGEQVVGKRFDGRPNTWSTEEPFDEVRYAVGESRGNFSVNLRVAADHTFISPPGVLGWAEGTRDEEHRVFPKPLDPRARIMCPLPATNAPGGYFFTATDLDQLLDSPIAMGELQVERFDLYNVPHYIVGYGAVRPPQDLRAFAEVASHAVQQGAAQFDGLPYAQYMFFCDFAQGGGGLEHAASTVMGIGRLTADQARGLIFHEYFHTWNVKRIRPTSFVHRDYSKPAVVSTLWWLEGVTDYYSDVWLYRAGLQTRDDLLRGLSSEISRMRSNRALATISAADASRRVWEQEGSWGFGGLSYYQKGKLIGFILDAAIRAETNGKACLDTVMMRLWEESKGGSVGYAEGRIRATIADVAGAETAQLFDQVVAGTGPMPFEMILPKVGLRIQSGQVLDDPSARADVRALGLSWPWPTGL